MDGERKRSHQTEGATGTWTAIIANPPAFWG